MTRRQPQPRRILAIDPFVSGIGFVVLEGPESLIDWGLRIVKGEKNAACVRTLEALIAQYDPNIIIVEDCQKKGCHLGERAKELIKEIVTLAKARRIRCQRFARLTVQKAFSQYRAYEKHQIAAELAEWFPELARHLPRPRKPSTSEDARMSIFDALALAIAHYEKRRFQPSIADQEQAFR